MKFTFGAMCTRQKCIQRSNDEASLYSKYMLHTFDNVASFPAWFKEMSLGFGPV